MDKDGNFRGVIAERHLRLFDLLKSGEMQANRLGRGGPDSPFDHPDPLRRTPREGDRDLPRPRHDAVPLAEFVAQAAASIAPAPRRPFWRR